MILSLLKKKTGREAEQEKARLDYELACGDLDTSNDSRIFRNRVALRARAHLDMCFIEGARKTEAYEEIIKLIEGTGREKPKFPEVSPFQRVQTVNGFAYTYVPEIYAQKIFKLGVQYQTQALTTRQAIDMAQSIANQMSVDLKITDPVQVLGFLREQLSAEGERTAGSGELDPTTHYKRD